MGLCEFVSEVLECANDWHKTIEYKNFDRRDAQLYLKKWAVRESGGTL